MKKGFTLIELIIVMVLISLIGTISIVLTKNNINDKTYTNSLKRALEAVNVYINTEKDSAGNTYFNGIYEGGEGVIVPIKDLYNKGYINETDYNVLIKKLSNDKEYFVAGFKNEDECTSGVSISIADANNINETTYICGYGSTGPQKNKSLYSLITSLPYHTNCLNNGANGLCFLHSDNDTDLTDENSDGSYDDVWYFKGDVNNNYIQINGLDKKFRIVRTTENRGIKIIEDSVISGVFYNKTRGGIGVFYSSYNSVPYISQKNYKLEEYKTYSGFRNYYDCSESSVTTTWDDSTSFTCKNDYGSTVSTKSPIYTYIYKPLLNRYNNIKSYLEQYIDKEYKWCITTNKSSTTSNITFKCNVEKNMESEFGILNLFEYKNIQYMVSSAQYIYGKNLGAHCSKNSEVAFTQVSGAQDFATTWAIDPGYENGDYCYDQEPVNIRPAYVIKGSSKVISGDGTKDNPYVIDGFET